MENFTLELEEMLDRKLGLYQRLNALMSQERGHIVDIDVEALWKSAETKKRLMNEVLQVRKEILDWFEACFTTHHMTEETFSLSLLIRSIPMAGQAKTVLREKKLAVDREKDHLAQRAAENKRYVGQYLSVIDEVMGVVADNSRMAKYNQKGHVSTSKNSQSLIYAEV